MKRVNFNEENNITYIMCAWAYAYRKSRLNNWEEKYLDDLRYKHRIKVFESKLKPYLTVEYRNKIYIERFM